MPLMTIDPNTVMTPGRTTCIDFDVPEYFLTQAKWGKTRMGGEVAQPSASGVADSSNYTGCYYWPGAQCWTLKPVQTDINDFSEYNTLSQIITLDRWYYQALASAQAGMSQFNSWRRPDDLNTASSSFMAATSDPFVKKVVPANATWSADITTAYRRVLSGVLMDRCLQSIDIFRANQGFFFRWVVPGTIRANPDFYMQIYFGQYCLAVQGSGHAHLYEFVSGVWKHRHKFRYSPPAHIAHTPHSLAIWPFTDQYGRRFIAFANSDLEAISAATGLNRTADKSSGLMLSAYSMDSGVRGTDPDTSPGFSTIYNYLEVDFRRDLRIEFQASTLAWSTAGTLIDLPDAMPPYLSNTSNLSILPIYQGTGLSAAFYDAATHGAWVPGTSSQPYAQFSFSGDGTDTPILWGYQYNQSPVITLVSPGQFTLGGTFLTSPDLESSGITQVRIESFDGSVQSQRGSVTVNDILGQYVRLRNRGQFATRTYVNYYPPVSQGGGPVTKVVIQRGRCIMPDWTKHGKPGRDVKVSYPNKEWREYVCPLLSMYERLNERVEGSFLRRYAIDPAAPNDSFGRPQPWKVTDKIKDLLGAAGFPSGMINIADNPIRLWQGAHGLKEDEYQIAPQSSYADIILTDARNFLGSWVYFNENAGTDGQWMLLTTPSLTSTPVAHFVTTQADKYTPPELLAKYPADTYPVWNDEKGRNRAPEYNMIVVRCPVNKYSTNPNAVIENYLINPVSCPFPGVTNLCNPDHPDFLGQMRTLLIVDPTLACFQGPNADQNTQAAVDWTCGRIYDFLCHGQRIITATAPYVFVNDPDISAFRPLRYQDLVTYDSVTTPSSPKYFIESATPEYHEDMHQFCDYELIDPLPGSN